MAAAAERIERAKRRTPKLSKNAATGQAAFTGDQDLAASREMLLIRRFEKMSGQMYGIGLIGGFCHLYIGQEAVVIGMQLASKEGDQVITGYRDHGYMLACGMDCRASWPN
jgi:pyruvate dehydrogenase E1 component alpha subunit